MKSSRFQVILLVIFGSLFAGGVMIFALTTATGNRSSVGAVSIWGTLSPAEFNQILKLESDFDERLVGASYSQIDADKYDTYLTESLARGKGPDLFLMDQSYALRDAGKTYHISYEQITPGQFSKLYVDSSRPFLASDGIVALPLFADPLVLYWNRDLMSSGGYTTPPQYWDELPEITKSITKRSDDGRVIKSAVAIGTYDNIESAKDIIATLLMQAGNPITSFTDDGHLIPALTTGASDAATLINALQFYTQFADPSKDVYTWNGSYESAQKSFASGDVALYIGHASERQLIAQTNPNLNFAVGQMLQYRNSPELNTARVIGLAIPRTSKNIGGAITVAAILTNAKLSTELSAAYGMTSALREVVTTKPKQTKTGNAIDDLVASTPKSLDELLNRSTAMSKTWQDPDPKQTGPVFRDMIEEIVSGTQSVNSSVSRLNAALKEIIGL